MKPILKSLIVLCTFFFSSTILHAQPGTLDQSFGNGGYIFTPTLSHTHHSILQPDGKIVVMGLTAGLTLDRFNMDGSIDSGFGSNGHTEFLKADHFYGTHFKTFGLISDGRIICATSYSINNKIDVALVMFKSNGILDSSFGLNGFDSIMLDFDAWATGLAVQSDGKIIISGDLKEDEYDYSKTFICRVLPNGGLDPDFGEAGLVVTHYTNQTSSNSLLLRTDGRILRGSTNNFFDSQPGYIVECFLPDGSIDDGFGVNGVATYIFGQGQGGFWNSTMEAMALQPDDKIICTGESGKGNKISMAICRFNEDGNIDYNFGAGGGTLIDYQNYKDIRSWDVASQTNGSVLLCGNIMSGNSVPILFIRLTQEGNLDTSFGEGGISPVFIDTLELAITSIHYLPTGKILLTGAPGYGIQLLRFNGDLVLATNFKDLKAVQEQNAITLSWQTLNENNTASFTVQRSGNAASFTDLATVPAQGGTGAHVYSYTDNHPLSGTNYYRIRENAGNGSHSFSAIVKIEMEAPGSIGLYPNPARKLVTITGLRNDSPVQIRVRDMQGRLVLQKDFAAGSTIQLDLQTLAPGAYYIQVNQDGKNSYLKLLKE